MGLLLGLISCGDQPKNEAQQKQTQDTVEKSNALSHLKANEYTLKFDSKICSEQLCELIQIQSLKTADPWLNQQIEHSLAKVIQDQLNQPESLNLKQASEKYLNESKKWVNEFALNQPYELNIHTKIPSQENQFALIQMIVNSKQAEVTVKDRGYFVVYDRKMQRKVNIGDVIQENQINDFQRILNTAYRKWLKQQPSDVKALSPAALDWKNAEWFFDHEGIGLHYRANELVKGGDQLDIFLNQKQTKQILKKEIYQKMF